MDRMASLERRDVSTLTRTTPVVFVPGASVAGRGWDLLRRHLERNGFTDVGRLGGAAGRGDIPQRAKRLAHQIATLREITGTDKVHVIGHGVGGVVARYFVQLLAGDDVVETLVTVGSPHAGSDVSPAGLGAVAAQVRPGSTILQRIQESNRPLRVRWINYFAERDMFVQPAASGVVKDPSLRAVNILVSDQHQLSLVLPTFVCRSIANEVAAAEGLPGFGTPVSALPGGIVRLDDAPALPDPDRALRERSKALHPSSYRGPDRSSAPLHLAPSG